MLDEDNVKALYRKAVANFNLGDVILFYLSLILDIAYNNFRMYKKSS